ITTNPYTAHQIFSHCHVPAIRSVLRGTGFSTDFISFIPQRPGDSLTGTPLLLGSSAKHVQHKVSMFLAHGGSFPRNKLVKDIAVLILDPIDIERCNVLPFIGEGSESSHHLHDRHITG